MIDQMFKSLLLSAMLLFAPAAIAQTVETEIHEPLITETIGSITPELKATQAAPVEANNDYRITISSDFGGGVVDYIEKYNKYRQAGAKLRIDDLCMSACTLVTGLMPASNVCVSPYAQLAFHSAWFMTMMGPAHSEEGTKLIWNIYPEAVREKLKAAGWDGGAHPGFIYFKGTDFYPLCD